MVIINDHLTLVRRFWNAVDSEGVGLFQWMGYIILSFGAGIYNLFFAAQPSTAVVGVMGQPYYEIWLWMLIVLPLVCLVGKSLNGDFTLTGMLLQLVGDVGAGGSLLIFTLASALTTDWGLEGNIGGFNTLIIFLCVVIFATRDVRRLTQVERRARK